MENKTKNSNTKDIKNTSNDVKPTLGVENDLRVVISSKADGVLFDQIACTCINIILNDDGEIATSFMGVHNENIVKQLERAQKAYFKAIKKTLKEERKAAKEQIDEEAESEKKSDSQEQPKNDSTDKSKVVNSHSPAYMHECGDSGKTIVKHKLADKDESAQTKTATPKKTKTTKPKTTRSNTK